MIRFNCPHCEKKLKAPERSAGRIIACPKCGQSLAVPPPVRNPALTSHLAADPVSTDSFGCSDDLGPVLKKSRMLWVVGVVLSLSLLVFLFAVFGVLFYLHSAPSKHDYANRVRNYLESRLDDPRDLRDITLGPMEETFIYVCPKCTRWLREQAKHDNHDEFPICRECTPHEESKKVRVLRSEAKYRSRTPLGGLAWHEGVFYFSDELTWAELDQVTMSEMIRRLGN